MNADITICVNMKCEVAPFSRPTSVALAPSLVET